MLATAIAASRGEPADRSVPELQFGLPARLPESWIADPDGVVWEAFHTHGETVTYGDTIDLDALSAAAAPGQCCEPAIKA